MRVFASLSLILILLLQLFTSSVTSRYCSGKWKGVEINSEVTMCQCDHEPVPAHADPIIKGMPCCEYNTIGLEDAPQIVDQPVELPFTLLTATILRQIETFMPQSAEISIDLTSGNDPPPDRPRYMLFSCQRISPEPLV